MSNRAKVIDDAFWKLVQSWPKSPDRHALEEILTSVFEAGRLETPDRDAARWRMLESEFKDLRARHDRYVYIPPRIPSAVPWDANNATLNVKMAVRWRLECAWDDATGNADTLPAFIDLLLRQRKDQERSEVDHKATA